MIVSYQVLGAVEAWSNEIAFVFYNCIYLVNIHSNQIRPSRSAMLFKGGLDSIFPHISDCSFSEHECSFFGDYGHFFLRHKLSRGTIIAANIGQAMVNLELWLSKSSSLHRIFKLFFKSQKSYYALSSF